MNTLKLYLGLALFSLGGLNLSAGAAFSQTTQPAGTDPASSKAAAAFRSVQAKCREVQEPGAGVRLWQDFLSRWPGSEPVPKAQEQLLLWQGRVQDHSRLIGKEWWPEQKLREGLAGTQGEITQARTALSKLAGRTDEEAVDAARKALHAALDKFPPHRDAYYLRGLANLQARQYAAAAADFQKAVELDGSFWPGWVNRAVALSRSRNIPAAVLACQQAALTGPPTGPWADLILDNFEEALNLLESGEAKLSSMQLARKQFEARLDQRAVEEQKQGRMRWGTSWLGRAEYQALQDRIAQVNTARQGPQARRQLAWQQIQEDQAVLRKIGQEAALIDETGRDPGVKDAPNPALVLSQRTLLFQQRDQLLKEIGEARESMTLAEREMADLEKNRPSPPYKKSLAAVDQALLDVLALPFGLSAASRPSATQPGSQSSEIMPWMVDSPLPPR